jgi:DNA anti-recombination protein RmuC
MNNEFLQQRVGLLNQEYQRAKQNVSALHEQLEQAKTHLNTVCGHLNEIAFLMGEEQKLIQDAKAAKDAIPSDSKEQGNDEINGKEQGQTA